MNVAAPRSHLLRWIYIGYMLVFFLYLAAPLLTTAIFAFNDSLFPTLPLEGFTLDWFFGNEGRKIGMFNDRRLMQAIGTSFYIGAIVAALSTAVGIGNAFLFERYQFHGKNILYIAMIVPLIIPGVILGISILSFANALADSFETYLGWELDFLRPGTFLIIIGQFSFLVTMTSLVILARLRKFDMSLEEAALNLGASRARVLTTVTLPYLLPAILSAFLVAFLMSFENFNTTMMLVGSDTPLTIAMYDRMVKAGSTPVLNAVSIFLMVGSGILALLSVFAQRKT